MSVSTCVCFFFLWVQTSILWPWQIQFLLPVAANGDNRVLLDYPVIRYRLGWWSWHWPKNNCRLYS